MKISLLTSSCFVLFVIFAANVASAQTCPGSAPASSTTGTNNTSIGTLAWGNDNSLVLVKAGAQTG